MCGYFANLTPTKEIIEVSNQLNLQLPGEPARAYQRQTFNALVTKDNNKIQAQQAMWWYALKFENDEFKVDERITSFNARDLNKPLWKEAFEVRRGLVFATQIGESQITGKHKQQYLMQSKAGFALGCVYQDWYHPNGSFMRSFAVITREPNPKYAQYHSKSTPLFLPLEVDILDKWLSPGPLDESLNRYTQQAILTCDFDVLPVQSYQQLDSLLPPFEMLRD
ncbi:MAG: SOS response-associated peptidase family protein [Saccharospirillaceae bacterium]|nr:SOS response-associated peptidase family protein [Pseudomonadales bacterium]NRB80151.1 SOS response-associated peptidase family protein [Saccharospirillaceae bacterium]